MLQVRLRRQSYPVREPYVIGLRNHVPAVRLLPVIDDEYLKGDRELYACRYDGIINRKGPELGSTSDMTVFEGAW
jgi:hypothetical protein